MASSVMEIIVMIFSEAVYFSSRVLASEISFGLKGVSRIITFYG